ncbi:hypothetical protein T01_4078 [Trichinella spiralis]|uniref:Uncharacterized protein n=1 Tax=Trichinella spiralis TaxID=6334 RepID=A0A0V1BER9_TRISP|nr:hypothetical protein T01_4078 [Trichinella spiralis]
MISKTKILYNKYLLYTIYLPSNKLKVYIRSILVAHNFKMIFENHIYACGIEVRRLYRILKFKNFENE